MRLLRLAVALALLPAPALALTDEIQVYTGDVAAPGVFNLTWHNNYTPDGLKTPDFPAGLVDNHSWSGVTEWAYGVTPWFEAGLYLPLYADSSNRGAQLNGFKLRTLFVNPDNATSNFYYGVNFEFSYNSRHWDEDRYTGEIRPIIGWRGEGWSLTFNPILDNSYKGFSRLDFAPGDAAGFRGRQGLDRSRPRNMTISASCAASCRPTSNRTSSLPWWTMMWGRYRWNSAPALA